MNEQQSKSLLHYVSLGQPGGVERHFADFVSAANTHGAAWQHHVLATGPVVHAYINADIEKFVGLTHEKYVGALKLPSRPKVLRHWHRRRCLRNLRPQGLLIWNRPARAHSLLAASSGLPWIYWEHGAAWFQGDETNKRHFYQATNMALANSHAAKRMLELRWAFQGDIKVCLNALRPSLLPTDVVAKALPSDRPFRLGIAGRLISIKGSPLVLHALKLLGEWGVNVELHIAGHGGLQEQLQQLAVKLGVDSKIHWHGLVRDMSAFYAHIDCLLHPALREPFGLVCIEAAAHGCPVVAAAVDGLPEAVQHEVTGLCIEPTLPLHDYPGLGGTLMDMPPYVYDPVQDAIGPPRLVDPEKLARVVADLASDRSRFTILSRQAISIVKQSFDFAAHVAKVMAIVDDYYRAV